MTRQRILGFWSFLKTKKRGENDKTDNLGSLVLSLYFPFSWHNVDVWCSGEEVTSSSRGKDFLQKCNVILHTIDPIWYYYYLEPTPPPPPPHSGSLALQATPFGVRFSLYARRLFLSLSSLLSNGD